MDEGFDGTDVTSGDSPATDIGASTPIADAPVGTQGLDAGTGAATAPALAPSDQPEGGAPATPLSIPADDSDLEGPNPPQGVEGIRQLRQAIRERDGELAQLRTSAEPLQRWGGSEYVDAGMGLMQQLFRPAVDPNTGQPITDEWGVAQVDPSGFVQQLAESSSGTLLALGDSILQANLPNGRPVIDVVIRDVLGLNPDMIDTYRQISSPAEAAGRGLLGEITPEELEAIPPQYHKAYQAMTPEERFSVGSLDRGTRDLLLSNAAEAQEARQFRQQQLQQQQAVQEQQYRQRQQQVEHDGYNLALQTRQQHVGSLQAEVGKIQFSADPAQNSLLQGFILHAANAYVDSDPEIQPLAQQTEAMYRQVKRMEAQGDKFRAGQLKIQADQNAQRIFAKARIYTLNGVKAIQGLMGQQGANGHNTARSVISGNGGQLGNSNQRGRDFVPFSDESQRLAQEIVDSLGPNGQRQGGFS